MHFDLHRSVPILERTPAVVSTLLSDLHDDWIYSNEGENTWSPFDIVGHLIHGEKTDWIPRLNIILSNSGNKTFQPFDRFAQFEESKGKSLNDLLAEFADLRKENLARLHAMSITPDMLSRTAQHPALGQVNLEQLLSSWVVHDLGHINQITRVMAKQYKQAVGPWVQYLGVLNR